MAVITSSMYEEAYTLDKRIVDRQLEKPDAIISLSELGMHIKSANMYLTCICAMLSGGHYGSTVNAKATDYFLGRIDNEYGTERLEIATNVLEAHVYYQSDKNNLPSLHQIVAKYTEIISVEVIL